MIRPPAPEELERLQEIEVVAGRAFVDVGMPEIASDEPLPLHALEAYRSAGRSWIVEVEGGVVGYVLVDVVDGHAHVEQVSVDPAFAGRRLGRDLLDHVAGWARARGDAAVTLTTFREVPWNAPYYERCGYRRLADHERGPELIALMAEEAAHGLDPADRVAMQLDLVPDLVPDLVQSSP
jgi:GNAT superfamily N-acetyltransferase